MNERSSPSEILVLAAEIVASHVSNNDVPLGDLPRFMHQVFASLADGASEGPPPPRERPQPAVPIKRSVMPDYIVCLEDGKKLKMLKRHLKSRYSMSPEQYRDRWGLPGDYPMVAPNYAAKRSALAKSSGLGTKPR